jgi:aminomethyltransferase
MKQIPLHELHASLGASFTDFGGYDMPVRYSSDLAEHHAVRSCAGLFDISHMAEIFVTGSAVESFLDFSLAGSASLVKIGKAKYSLILDSSGGIIDDLIIYRLSEFVFLVVANASNRDVVFDTLQSRAEGFEVLVQDKSDEYALLAIQGPASEGIIQNLTDFDVSSMKYYSISEVELAKSKVLLARTGYTGEDGFEIYIPSKSADQVFREILSEGSDKGLIPAGLACRDTLRLEAGMPLYGHELDRSRNPYQAGLGRVIPEDKQTDFVGKAALVSLQNPELKLVGLVGEGKRAARAGYLLYLPGALDPIGEITSGALSPTLGYPIAMAYVSSEYSELGTELEADIRGSRVPVKVSKLPFYRRQS